jgi:hypothetical protein
MFHQGSAAAVEVANWGGDFMKVSLASIAGLALCTALAASETAQAKVQFWTMTGVAMTGIFGTISGGGTFTTGKGAADTSNMTINENIPGTPYTYNFTGPVNGSGWTQTSQIIPSCILGPPCPPVGTATFHLDSSILPGPVAVSFEDTGMVYSGRAVLSVATPEPASWTLLILGLAGLGGALRRRAALA